MHRIRRLTRRVLLLAHGLRLLELLLDADRGLRLGMQLAGPVAVDLAGDRRREQAHQQAAQKVGDPGPPGEGGAHLLERHAAQMIAEAGADRAAQHDEEEIGHRPRCSGRAASSPVGEFPLADPRGPSRRCWRSRPRPSPPPWA